MLNHRTFAERKAARKAAQQSGGYTYRVIDTRSDFEREYKDKRSAFRYAWNEINMLGDSDATREATRPFAKTHDFLVERIAATGEKRMFDIRSNSR